MEHVTHFFFCLSMCLFWPIVANSIIQGRRERNQEYVKKRKEVMKEIEQRRIDENVLNAKEFYRQHGEPLPDELKEPYRQALIRKAKRTFILLSEKEIEEYYNGREL